MKLRLISIFIAAALAFFLVLNFRFVFANAKFWLETKIFHTVSSGDNLGPFPLPLAAGSFKSVILSDSAVLTIEKLGIPAPIVFGAGTDTKRIYNELENGVVHYSDTPKPGENGASVILGHSSAYPWYRGSYGSVFALLGQLRPGDTFSIKYQSGQRFVFTVKRTLIFKPLAENSQLTNMVSGVQPSVILISCWPVGTNYRRIAVQGELI